MGTIEGTVSDGDGNGIEGVLVTATDSATGDTPAAVRTDANGDYSASVPGSTYDVGAERISYQPAEETGVNVGSSETKTVDLTLSALQPKVIGSRSDVGVGVLAETTAGSGVPIGVEASVDSPDGYGFYTPDDVWIEGALEALAGHTLLVDGTTKLSLGPPGTDFNDANTSSGGVVAGYEGNSVRDDVVGATISGGGSAGTQDLEGDIGVRDNVNRVSDNFGTVGGGRNNLAGRLESESFKERFATVGGGEKNSAAGEHATVGGGEGNLADAIESTIAGGVNNVADGIESTVGGGKKNAATAGNATVGGGEGNEASGGDSTVGGGEDNVASGTGATVGGGDTNEAEALCATIAGGGPSQRFTNPDTTNNVVYDDYGTIGGGGNNQAGSDDGTEQNRENATFATVAGGRNNTARESYASIGGGDGNDATGTAATIGGGDGNSVGGTSGSENNDAAQTVAGGDGNEAVAYAATVGGGKGNRADGSYATVPGGRNSRGQADDTFAAGRGAKAKDAGAFVWGDRSSNTVESATTNEVVFQAGGGMTVYTDSDTSSNTGAELPSSMGSWTSLSAASAKSDIESVEPTDVLDRVETLDVATWRYDGEDQGVRHMGPMAGDFADAFGLGHDSERIANVDADGVALAAIQGLSAELDRAREELAAKDDRIESQAQRIDTLEAENEALRERLAAIEDRLGVDERDTTPETTAD